MYEDDVRSSDFFPGNFYNYFFLKKIEIFIFS